MIHIHCLEDTKRLDSDPLLQREVCGYLSACILECDVEDDPDVDFAVLDERDLPVLAGLGEPEETARIEIHVNGTVRIITRLVFVATVYFAPFDIGNDTEVPSWPD